MIIQREIDGKMESERRKDFDAVYEEYRHEIFRAALVSIHNPNDAEDIAQEVFIRYYIYSSHSEVSNPKSWLMVTAKNLAYNYVKHAKYERLLHEEENMELLLECEPDLADTFFENMWKREILEYTDRVLEVVKARKKKWYDALIYAYCMEMPRQDIADCMDISLDALSSMLQRAKNWIKENYKDEFDHIIKA